MAIKQTHMMFALLSIILFYARSISRFMSGKLASDKRLFIGSHTIDTLLLVSAVSLLITASINPIQHPWLIEKITLLIVYIVFGMVLAKSKQLTSKAAAFVVANIALGLIGYLASTKVSLIL